MPAPPHEPNLDSMDSQLGDHDFGSLGAAGHEAPTEHTPTEHTPASQAAQACARAWVSTATITDFQELTAVSRLLESVWGRSEEGVPINSDVLRSLAHAGGCVTGAYDVHGQLVGAAALSPGHPAHESYSLIAAAQSGAADRGIGAAIKLAQRAWALERGITTMRWTFDPLVSRNARFNLVKLGAYADVYEDSFYGEMSDEINGHDQADRLVATWQLESPRVLLAVERSFAQFEEDDRLRVGQISELAPDQDAGLIRGQGQWWCRVPTDIVAIRHTDPNLAMQWRVTRRRIFHAAFADGLVATSISRDGWYHLTPPPQEK